MCFLNNLRGDIVSITDYNANIQAQYNFGVTWQAGVGGYGYLNGVSKGNVAASYLPNAIA